MVAVNNISFGYRPAQPLFSGLCLQLQAGHIYGLLGKNGVGKSTLLRNIAGLTFPVSGSCTVNGRNTSRRQAAALTDIYFLPEDVYVPALTPEAYARRTGAFYPGFSMDSFHHNLQMLDIDGQIRMDKQSFGQQKKAMIAFGIAANTALLIMDEPTNGLDIPSKAQFRKLVASVLSTDRCIVISTHQVRDLDNLIDILLILHNGDIAVNHSLDAIAAKLVFGNSVEASMNMLYEEEGAKGMNRLAANTGGSYSKVDVELLFNAITGNNKEILNILKKEMV